MTQAGPAIPVVVSTLPPDGGPALRVAVVADGRPTEGGPARPVVVVSDGRPTQGNEPLPVVLATGAQASMVLAGPPIPVVVVSGSLGGAAPVNTVLPTISGVLTIAQILTATNGTWTNSPTSYTYQWKRNGVAIGGATSSTYTTVVADSGATITVTVTASNASGSTSATSATSAMRTLAFYDEFSGGSLDLTKWTPYPPANLNGGHGENANELQANIAGAITQSGGNLVITATKVNPPGPQVFGLDYTSGAPTTYLLYAWSYARVEVRFLLPAGAGQWPAIWMLPPFGDQNAFGLVEIDIFEYYGQNPATISQNYHDAAGTTYPQQYTLGHPWFNEAWHVLAVEWQTGKIEWFLDNVLIYTVTTMHVASCPLYLLIQNAIGGTAGVPNDAALPSQMLIDYVHVYTPLTPLPTVPTTGLLAQWKGDSIPLGTVDDDLITDWSDSSGNGHTAHASSGHKPAYAAWWFDNWPSIKTGLPNSMLTDTIAHAIGTGDMAFACVIAGVSFEGNERCIASNGAYSPGFYVSQSHPYIYWGASKPFATTLANDTPYILYFERVSGVFSCYVNGVLDATTYTITTSMADAAWTLFDDTTGGYFNYRCAEILLYSGSGQRAAILNYLNSKYLVY